MRGMRGLPSQTRECYYSRIHSHSRQKIREKVKDTNKRFSESDATGEFEGQDGQTWAGGSAVRMGQSPHRTLREQKSRPIG